MGDMVSMAPGWLRQCRNGDIPYMDVYKDENNNNHREDGPAEIEWYEADKPKMEIWKKHGEWHRLDGPAYVEYHENGQIEFEEWYIDGWQSRPDGGPTNIWFKENGELDMEIWRIEDEEYDRLHRLDGPAVIKYKDGEVKMVEWFIDGDDFDIDELAAYIALPKADKVALKMIK